MPTIELPESGWSDEKMDEFRARLRAAMPRDTMITDLWSWGVHFEDGDQLSDDWLVEAAFGSDDSLDDCVDQIVELFHSKVREYDMDYDQHSDPDAFDDLVTSAAHDFIVRWRQRMPSRFEELDMSPPRP